MKPRGCLLTLLALWGFVAVAPQVQADDFPALSAALKNVDEALATRSDGFYFDDDPETLGLLEQRWSIEGRWVARYLALHKSATAAELAASLKKLKPGWTAGAVRLAPKTFLVSLDTVFVVAERHGRYRTVWRIGNASASDRSTFPVLAAWSASAARKSCRKTSTRGSWDRCGPMDGIVGSLPAQRNGAPRFYLNGTYETPFGNTVGGQISLWRWNGRGADPLLAKTYAYYIDQKWLVRIRHNILHLNMKQEFKSFFACGSCEGRQVDWRVRLGPKEIKPIGTRSMVPELDLVDALFDRLFRRKSVAEIASPAVAAALNDTVENARQDAAKHGFGPTLGMLMGWRTTAGYRRKTICLSTDDSGAYRFSVISRNGRPWISSVAILGDVDCRS